MKDQRICIRINADIKEKAEAIIKTGGFSLSGLINVFLTQIVRNKRVPICYESAAKSEILKSKSTLTLRQIKKAAQQVAEEMGGEKIKRIYLFGSYSHGDESEESDVDFHIVRGPSLTALDVAHFEGAVSQRLEKKVDAVCTESFIPEILKEVKKDEVMIYEAS